MTGRERVRRAVGFEHPDRVPRDLWALPGVEMFRKAELDEVRARFPPDITRAESPYARADRERGTPCVVGSYSDLWGATWQVGEPGVIGEVKHPPLADWSALETYRWPDPHDPAFYEGAEERFEGSEGALERSFGCAVSDEDALKKFD